MSGGSSALSFHLFVLLSGGFQFAGAGSMRNPEAGLYMLTRTQRSLERENPLQMGDSKWGLKVEQGEDLSWLNHMALVSLFQYRDRGVRKQS